MYWNVSYYYSIPKKMDLIIAIKSVRLTTDDKLKGWF